MKKIVTEEILGRAYFLSERAILVKGKKENRPSTYELNPSKYYFPNFQETHLTAFQFAALVDRLLLILSLNGLDQAL